MSSAVSGNAPHQVVPYEFGAHDAGPVACELMARHPDLTIRIDVEHEIVNPVAENYDIVFAMPEAPLSSAGIVIRRVSSLERGLFTAHSLLERFGEPRSLEDLAKLPLVVGPNDTTWSITPPGGKAEHLAVDRATLVSSNAHIRLQAGHGVLRVTASFTRAAVEAGTLKRLLPDHLCEPLSVHALLPARQFVPAKVRCFLDALEIHAHRSAAHEPSRYPVNPIRVDLTACSAKTQLPARTSQSHDIARRCFKRRMIAHQSAMLSFLLAMMWAVFARLLGQFNGGLYQGGPY